ncbi:uncharacterized protein BJ171DRAFT_501703 [Polychytrium aggregatum]|uniref:uncharacterized protein n=1 Tax=Polychytrium aggregatum TaxID=110093 RepID=UPI0022FED5A3|nr:uncharacterized protein BJ171DRAFT_501703 [Polychytrium aggregatum]KAI9205291.1 hypothetical protein BJ171DRAFT_501703 [Polychytrium aggregatum]
MAPMMEILCTRATQSLAYFVENKLIDAEKLRGAKGIAIAHFKQVGAGPASIKGGSGLLFGRLADRSWSAPLAIDFRGAAVGLMIGLKLTEVLILIQSEAALESLASSSSFTIGRDFSASFGRHGLSNSASSLASGAPEPFHLVVRCKGIFAGVSFDGLHISLAETVNCKFYSVPVKSSLAFNGTLPPPAIAGGIYGLLDQYEDSDEGQVSVVVQPHTSYQAYQVAPTAVAYVSGPLPVPSEPAPAYSELYSTQPPAQ